MTVIKIVAFIIFVISCVTIYHNTNAFEPIKRIIFIILGLFIMYVITSIICSIKTSGLVIESEGALKETINVIKIIFVPINAMIGMSIIGNILGKLKEKTIDMGKAKKRLIIGIILFIIIILFEASYIGSFITYLLG